MQVECVVPSRSQLGEGAVWDDRGQALWWVDIKAGLIHRTREDGSNGTTDFGEPVGCFAIREGGGLVVAAKSGFWLFDPDTGEKSALSDPEAHLPGNRFNDGTTDMQGRFWAGTMKDDGGPPAPQGSFYRMDTDFSVTKWKDGIYTTNGLAFSPDGRTMYFSDSNPDVRTIWAADYDTDTGTPGDPRVFFDTRAVPGRPDGGTVDADGCYWQAGVGGWQLYRITPDGKVDMTIDMPVERPTKPMWGGSNLDILYVTSIGAADDPKQPEAGSLFAVTGTGCQGVPQARFPG
ncbi:SMP-30/gluconolactonase/LRE family protein [Psychromarinibacter halotolerans]|uniref:SMP-30/gluconolactonase/LRE family protein n=1 Tax=Psychromarinibacter halotolerans TaxID=1775175 RepID=A0ABV7GQW9_9RHOB|nr:SMP-30/gluconolactonase/LRE family protein [Psychromarinibacter halotolerans]MDF0597276.1 SMP-30/gluconolactonase/LRE family protein [Psychromarinibacter halotolerans]